LTLDGDHASIHFVISKDYFNFSLRNRSDAPIQLDWNLVSFVDIDNKAHRVIHNGVRLDDRDKPQVPSVVPPEASIDDQVISVDSVQLDAGQLHARPFFQVDGATALALKGRSFSVLFPIVSGGITENLFVTFLIEDVTQ
jgi:hypothetical protein